MTGGPVLSDAGGGTAELAAERIDSTAHAVAAARDGFDAGFHRVQVRVRSGTDLRRFLRAGFRREGVLRGFDHGFDIVVLARLATDPEPDTVAGWTAVMDSVMATKRVIAHILFRDLENRALLLQTSFKADLELQIGRAHV